MEKEFEKYIDMSIGSSNSVDKNANSYDKEYIGHYLVTRVPGGILLSRKASNTITDTYIPFPPSLKQKLAEL